MSTDPLPLALSFLVVAALAIPVLRFRGKQLGQLSGAPGQGMVVGDGYGGKDGSYTLDDVKLHDKRDDVWVIIKNKVYDLSEFIDEHPGGVESILKRAGGDATDGFFGPQHPSRVHDMIDEYLMGKIVESEKDK
jgi:cytochrome b involved in lipid metabolism